MAEEPPKEHLESLLTAEGHELSTSRGNRTVRREVDAAETRFRTVVAPTGFEPVLWIAITLLPTNSTVS